jgi:CBS domain-containing protein
MKTSYPISSILHQKTSALWHIAPEATVFDAIKLMADKNIGALPVMSGGHCSSGSSRNAITRAKSPCMAKPPSNTSVWEIISKEVVTVAPDESVEECMRLMTEHRIRHLPVVQNLELLGIISIGDLVNWIISAQNATIEQMEQYIGGSVAA